MSQRAYEIDNAGWVAANFISANMLDIHANFPVGSSEGNTEITVYCNDKSEHVMGSITNTNTVTTSMDVSTDCQLTLTEGCTLGTTPSNGIVTVTTSGYDVNGKGTLTGPGTFKYLLKGNGTLISLSGGVGLPKADTLLTIEPDISEGTPEGGEYVGQVIVKISVL